MTPQETPDQSEIEKLIDPAAENYLPEQIQRELLRCAGANGRISVDYLFAIYRCGQAAERVAHAAEFAAAQNQAGNMQLLANEQEQRAIRAESALAEMAADIACAAPESSTSGALSPARR